MSEVIREPYLVHDVWARGRDETGQLWAAHQMVSPRMVEDMPLFGTHVWPHLAEKMQALMHCDPRILDWEVHDVWIEPMELEDEEDDW